MNPQTFMFIGRSGCGKGTQAGLIKSYLKKNDPGTPIYYLETGAKFREFIKKNTYTSNISKKIYESGGKQPSFLATWAWSNLFVEDLKGNEHLFIDGTPRSLPEALSILDAMDFYERKANIIYINVPRELSEKRLMARGRMDDDLSKVRVRLDWFDKEVMPAVEHLRKTEKHNFIEVSGDQEAEGVHKDIMSKMVWF